MSYKNITKHCTTYTIDGQAQKQCLADFTLSVSNIKKNYKIVLSSKNEGFRGSTIVGQFTSKGSSASKRFKNEVAYYGPRGNFTRIK